MAIGQDGDPIERDEIKKFIEARYISASEASWRLFGCKTHDHKPVVYRLAVHLENMQTVCFDSNSNNLNQILNGNHDTTLIGWFKLNQIDSNARNIYYTDIPNHYVWCKKNKIWKKRKNVKDNYIISRMYTAHPNDVERYSLRILLTNVKGATSFEDMRTVDSQVYPTYKQAAIARGLISDDRQIYNTLEEAYNLLTNSHGFRVFFVNMLINTQPDALDVWEHFKDKLSEDILYNIRSQITNPDMNQVYSLTLQKISELLVMNGTSIRNFPQLYNLPYYRSQLQQESLLVSYEQQYSQNELNAIISENIPKLNADQLQIFNLLTNNQNPNIQLQHDKLYFVNGSGGTGKTFLYNTLLAYLRFNKKIPIVIASSGK
jgi:ATP-dependent DNA helicase PIF1